jgi:sugar lactone lactonase YvrE
MAVDPNGNIYIAPSAHKGIQVFNAAGARLGQIPLPEVPLYCGIGGEGQKTLFVTTATEVISVKLVIDQSTVSVRR